MIKKILKPFIPQAVLNILRNRYQKKLYKEWENNENPVPPPHIVKQMTISEYQQKYGYSILVETGTYMGDMVESQKKRFKQVFSIELGVELFNKAKKDLRMTKMLRLYKVTAEKYCLNCC